MASTSEWGRCSSCQWWQLEPGVSVDKQTTGQCIEQSLQRVLLSVTGSSGCNVYSAGEPARGPGSGKQPPTGQPSR